MNRDRTWAALIIGILLLGGSAAVALAEPNDDVPGQLETTASVTIGYRGVSTDDNPGRAREYDRLEASPVLGAKLFTDPGPYHLDLNINYLDDDDYAAAAHLDTRGLLRLDLRAERFYHNLDHIPYANGFTGGESYPPPPTTILTRAPGGPAAEGSRPDAADKGGPYRAYYTDQNPGDDYGLRLDVSEAKLKLKTPDYPAHLTLSYWRYEKQGEKQLRFVGENCTTACHMQSRTREIDRVTEEVKAGLDAHAGYVDIVLEGLLRTFRDRESVPVDTFGYHSAPGLRDAGGYEHDEDPESKLKEVTLKLNSAPSGGFVASAAFTIGERENQSDLTSVAPVEAEVDYYRASADATYTPSQNWTFALRYRLLDMDSDNSSQLYDTVPAANAFTPSPLPVRSSLDVTRAWYEAVASYRPSSHLTLKAEFRREDIDRDLGPADDWDLPEQEIITRVKLGFSSRMLEKSALKLSGWLAITRDDDPAYGTSYGDGQELFLTTSYTPSPLWGVQANLNLLKQENDDHEYAGLPLSRDKEQQNISAGAWVNPREGLSFDLNYGYFHTTIDQDLLFGASTATFVPGLGPTNYIIQDNSVDYRQTVQTITAGMTWQALEHLACRLEGYHIRSKADFSPDFDTRSFPYDIYGNRYTGTASSSDLEEISELDIRQNGVRGRIDWQVDEHLSCGLEATFDDYDERGSDVFDGSAQTYMASLTYSF